MMLLLRGPAGSGKTARILEQLRSALREGGCNFRLLVPTATMAQHLRNEMAREGFLLRPDSILTLSRFVDPWVKDLAPVSDAALSLLIERALDRLSPPEFQRVAGYPGFRVALARLIQEVSAAGGDSNRLSVESAAFAAVFADVENELARRQCGLQPARLKIAAARIASGGVDDIQRVWLDGFFSFTAPELAVVDAIRHHAQLTVTLPSWDGNQTARESLLAMGFEEEELQPLRAKPAATLMVAPTLDQEVEEIARRILEHAGSGRPFREIGIVVRAREPYVPALETTLHRFGIPARYYFGEPLAGHFVTRYLVQVVESMLGGWEHDGTLRAIRMMESGAAGDRFEFHVRERLPGRGLDGLRELTTDFGLRNLIDAYARLDAWRVGSAQPKQWAKRAKTLRALVRLAPPKDGVSHERAAAWRGDAAALNSFCDALDETAIALGDAAVPFAEFWQEAKAVLRETTLRIPDQRRNVVHVIDAYEARQWELPVIFVCGLLEKQFPQYHSQDPIISDASRLRLRNFGLRLRTATDWDQEERFLFELATTRATHQLVLSYPRFNAAGDENLRSFYLEQFLEVMGTFTTVPHFRTSENEGQVGMSPYPVSPPREEKAVPVRPQPAHTRAVQRVAAIYDEQLRRWIADKFRVIRPTAIELFLQCPFRFFSEQTLGLRTPPSRPEDRLDPLVQGTIIHQVLSEWQHEMPPLEPLFTRIFDEQCARKRVPPGYQTETLRREMLRNLERALPQVDLKLGWKVFTEEPFRFELESGLEISGRIDRYDVSPNRQALVIDYKYSSETSLKQRVKEDDDSNRYVQGGLYLLALEQSLGYEPAGMLYCGLKKKTTWHGRHMIIGLNRGEVCIPQVLREDIDQARELSLSAVRQIREGRIGPAGTDVRSCQYCDSYDLCRIESAGRVQTAGEPAR